MIVPDRPASMMAAIMAVAGDTRMTDS